MEVPPPNGARRATSHQRVCPAPSSHSSPTPHQSGIPLSNPRSPGVERFSLAALVRPRRLAMLGVFPLWLGCSDREEVADFGRTGSGGGLAAAGQTGGSHIAAGGGQALGGQSNDGSPPGGIAAGGGGAWLAGGTAAGSASGGASGPASGGAGASASAGSAGTAGGPAGSAGGGSGGASAGKGSPGCGSGSPLESGSFAETIDGTTRRYVLDVPANYDANRRYRLIFVWHPLGGSAAQVVLGGYDGLKALSEGSAVFVAADGLLGANTEAIGPGWWNVNNGDMLFLSAMLTKLKASLCIDEERVFSTGFSFGGMMSYAVGYEFDVFRAIAPCSGDMQVIPRKDTFTRPLPIMAFHGDKDTFVTTARGRAARDKYLARNGCGAQTVPASPSPCVQYQGCQAPTLWCEFPGGHSTWSEQPQAIWKFFSQF
jgi:polyhydroxybutyrate depolymerase